MAELQKEVKGLQLQLLAHSNAELEQGRRLQELEADRKKFHAQAMKLALKNEELLLKYDPGNPHLPLMCSLPSNTSLFDASGGFWVYN